MNSIDRRETHKDATVAVDRRSSRNKVLKGAHVAFNNEFSAIPCTVRNVSETGARLVIEGGWFVPDTFVLHVDIDGYKIECKRVWQKGSECGVRFIGEKRMTRSKCQQVLTPDAELENVHLGRHQSRQNVVNSPSEAAVKHAKHSGSFGRRTR